MKKHLLKIIRSKFIIWGLIPIVLIGGIIIDLNLKYAVHIPFSYFGLIYSGILIIMGGVNYGINKLVMKNKVSLFFYDVYLIYSIVYTILLLLITFIESSTKMKYFLGLKISFLSNDFLWYGLLLFFVFQALAIGMLIWLIIEAVMKKSTDSLFQD